MSSQCTLEKIIRYIDLIGQEPKFLIRGSKKFKTVIGGFIFLCISILCVLCVYAFGKDIYYRKEPIVRLSKIQDVFPKE